MFRSKTFKFYFSAVKVLYFFMRNRCQEMNFLRILMSLSCRRNFWKWNFNLNIKINGAKIISHKIFVKNEILWKMYSDICRKCILMSFGSNHHQSVENYYSKNSHIADNVLKYWWERIEIMNIIKNKSFSVMKIIIYKWKYYLFVILSKFILSISI